MKWQPFFEIEDGGDRRLELLKLCIFYFIDVFQIQVPVFPLMLMTIGKIVSKWLLLFEIENGGDRHLEFAQLY